MTAQTRIPSDNPLWPPFVQYALGLLGSDFTEFDLIRSHYLMWRDFQAGADAQYQLMQLQLLRFENKSYHS